jgi:hypothetical protein
MTSITFRFRQKLPQPIALPALAVFLVSAALIGLELALMRCLSVAGWHHFSYLVISTALLGFGASGTLLTLFGPVFERRFGAWCTTLTIAFALSIPLCFRTAQTLPLDPQYVLYSARQVALMVTYHLLFFVSFLLGATVIGLSLMHFGKRVHVLYGANLLGSGLGGLWILLLMFVLPEMMLLYAVAGLSLVAAVVWIIYSKVCPVLPSTIPEVKQRRSALLRWFAVAITGTVLILIITVWPQRLRIDPYKSLAMVQRWETQSDAERLLTRHSPRARLDIYDSPLFHETLFAGFTALSSPPPQLGILADGHLVGTVFEIKNAEEAAILDHTPMSVPYRVIGSPRVLLLGETGGTNVWLARRFDAASVTVVQGNPQVIRLLKGPLNEAAGGVLALPGMEAVAADPRLFLEGHVEQYDIIQLVRVEGMTVGVSSLLSVHEDYLLTREGLALCLRRLRPGGLLSVTRQQQDPPRDNVKILATMAQALDSLGVQEPGRHIVQFRNYLAVTTLVSPTVLEVERCTRILSACGELQLDIEWAPCPGVDPTDQIARISGPPGEDYSYYHYAAREIFSPRREEFLRDWAYNVQPPSDDSPYFYNFFRWGSIPLFRQVYGKSWFRKLELGYVVVVGVLIEVVVVGVVLILLPLLWLKRRSTRPGGRPAIVVYFLLLGITYMLLEMVLIAKFTHFLGDPILSAGGVVSAFLVFSGLGSIFSTRLFRNPLRAIGMAVLGIVVITLVYTFALDSVFSLGCSWSTAVRFGLVVLLAAPLAFLMGWPFPNGLGCVERRRPALVPWAWSVNGFASVAGPPMGVLLAVTSGFSCVMLLAALLYGCVGLVAWILPGMRDNRMLKRI